MYIRALILLFFAICMPQISQADPTADEATREFLASKENEEESGQSRGLARADLDGDGTAEIVLVWTLLGPTYWRNYLSVLRKTGPGYAEAATALLNGEAELGGIDRGVVSVKQNTFAPDDPRCCPSRETMGRYRWEGGDRIVALP